MAFELEQREARHILESIELGSTSIPDCFALINDADPTLVYFIITWLRSRYANHSASEGVLGRIIALMQAYPKTAQILKKGKADALVDWFEETYAYRDLDAGEFLAVVVEKLES
ncbi:MAG: hypothetical protein KC912_20510 [Proteobacteria bacterium]|nr:hypothetical protein [Pseudomonadota bacterium]